MPADGGGEEEGLGTFEGGDAGTFGVPLVPADEGADGAVGGLLGLEAEVAGGEVELLVVEGIVRDVHLAVLGGEGAVLLEDGYGVVVKAGGSALEEGGDDDDSFLVSRPLRGASVEGPGMDSAVSKRACSSRWQKYWARKSSGRQMMLAPARGGVAGEGDGFGEVFCRVYSAGHLDEGDFFVGGGHEAKPLIFDRRQRGGDAELSHRGYTGSDCEPWPWRR